jgi:trypsin
MTQRATIGVTVLAILVALTPLAVEAESQAQALGTRHPRIVNGLISSDFPAAGALLLNEYKDQPISENAGESWCTGTLIGCQTFLTAAHCVEEESDPGYYTVFLQHGGFYSVQSLAMHPDYDPFSLTSDVAVLKLGEAVTGITPQPLPQSDPLLLISGSGVQPGTIVGFGRSGGDSEDYGLKRYGEVQVDYCSSLADVGFENPELLCWIFEKPLGAPGQDSNTCNGDSGGPLFMELDGEQVVAGITSWGSGDDCLPVDESVDSNVYYFRSFIEQELGSDPTSACGSIPVVGSNSVAVVASEGLLSGSSSSATHDYEAQAGGDVLRFGLNSLDDGAFDADIFVRHGGTATPQDYDCKSDGWSSYGFCGLGSPAGGEWSVFVQSYGGTGQYQLTASLFGTTRSGLVPAPEPGSAFGGVVILGCLGLRARSRCRSRLSESVA